MFTTAAFKYTDLIPVKLLQTFARTGVVQNFIRSNEKKRNKLGLSCSKLRANLDLSDFYYILADFDII